VVLLPQPTFPSKILPLLVEQHLLQLQQQTSTLETTLDGILVSRPAISF